MGEGDVSSALGGSGEKPGLIVREGRCKSALFCFLGLSRWGFIDTLLALMGVLRVTLKKNDHQRTNL